MKKFLTFLTLIYITPCMAAISVNGGAGDGLSTLHNEIKRLEQELATKTAKLNKCAEKNKNFQIAGIAAVGLAGAGITTNVSLNSKIKSQEKQVKNMNNKIQTTNTNAENWAKQLAEAAKDCDIERTATKLEQSLTPAEKQRLAEIESDNFDIEKEYNGDINNIPESDQRIMQKILSAMQHCND